MGLFGSIIKDVYGSIMATSISSEEIEKKTNYLVNLKGDEEFFPDYGRARDIIVSRKEKIFAFAARQKAILWEAVHNEGESDKKNYLLWGNQENWKETGKIYDNVMEELSRDKENELSAEFSILMVQDYYDSYRCKYYREGGYTKTYDYIIPKEALINLLRKTDLIDEDASIDLHDSDSYYRKKLIPDGYLESCINYRIFKEKLENSDMSKYIVDTINALGSKAYWVMVDERGVVVQDSDEEELINIRYKKQGYPNLEKDEEITALKEYLLDNLKLAYEYNEDEDCLELDQEIRESW